MHLSRLCAVLIDCNTSHADAAARFRADALGRPVDPDHPGSRGNYRMLDTPPKAPDDGPARFNAYDRFSRPAAEVPPSGVLSLTEGCSAGKGRWPPADCRARTIEFVKREFSEGAS